MKNIFKIIGLVALVCFFGQGCFVQGKDSAKIIMHPYGIITCYFDRTEDNLYILSCEIDRDLKNYCNAYGSQIDLRCVYPDSFSFTINGQYPHYINPVYSKEEAESLEILVRLSYMDMKRKKHNLLMNLEFEPVKIVFND